MKNNKIGEFVSDIINKNLGLPFDVYTQHKIEDEIREKSLEKCPNIYNYIRIERS